MFHEGVTIALNILYRNRVFLLCVLTLTAVGITFIQYSGYFSKDTIQQRTYHEVLTTNKALKRPSLIESMVAVNVVNPLVSLSGSETIETVTISVEEKRKKMIEVLSKLERIVHIDLKGAPPKIDYFKDFIPMLKKFGATGILIEYEDMFPFKGQLEEVKHGHAYSEDDVRLILKLAKDNGLTVMPLVQTYGHLEWLLKHKKFAHLRENAEFPQVISPCIDQTYDVLYDMLDQVIALHPDVPYFHIGCDEVYYKLENEKCRTPDNKFNGDFTTAFMSHVVKLAEHIRKKIPKASIVIWDDMMHVMSDGLIDEMKPAIDEYEIEPMVWEYMENVNSPHPSRFAKWFKNIWAASAYKGANGELATVTSVEHHYLNHRTWAEQIYAETSTNVSHFRGIALTGWSRYDHFLQLCDLLPEAIPSLVFNLQTMQLGSISQEKRQNISKELGCAYIPWTPQDYHLESLACSFPGREVYEAILPMTILFRKLKENMEDAKKYMSPISFQYNYAHKARAIEVMEKLKYIYKLMLQFKENFMNACKDIYWEDTVNEWLTVYFMPDFDALYEHMKSIMKTMKRNDWLPRPLPIKIKEHQKLFSN